jgi:hypothetical protein
MKGRSKREAGGGVNAAEKDLSMKTERRNIAPKIFDEAEKRKAGGKVKGDKAMSHAGRKPRKSGGRTGSDGSPFSSALKGTPAAGRKLEKMTMGTNI